jgi:hypothetical protein
MPVEMPATSPERDERRRERSGDAGAATANVDSPDGAKPEKAAAKVAD